VKFNKTSKRFGLGMLLIAAAASAGASGYRVAKSYAIGGDGGWDYLTADSATRKLYISRASHVIVADLDTGKQVGEIADTPGVHGIALAPDLGKGFVSNGKDGTVSIFDLKTLATTSKVKAGENPDAILYDSATKRVFAFNGRSKDASVMDADKGTALGTIKLGGKPEFAVSDGKGGVWVNIEDTSELLAIDPAKMEVKSRYPLKPCESPSGLSMDRKNRRLFVGCDNKMMAIVNADSGKIVTTLPIADGVDATAFDEGTGLAFASCGEGVLSIIKEESADKFSSLDNVPTQAGARTLALDDKTHNVIVVTAKFGAPPAATADNPHPRRSIEPGSFVALVVGK